MSGNLVGRAALVIGLENVIALVREVYRAPPWLWALGISA
jgi:hypothetical protein